MASNSKPWQTEGAGGSGDFKYQYHPGGNPDNAPKDAPSALHSVIIPNVNLPKVRQCVSRPKGRDGKGAIGSRNAARSSSLLIFLEVSKQRYKDPMLTHMQDLHEKYNKWGKEGY